MPPVVHITADSEIPLIGCIAFGLIDRGTNVIQVRPTSICTLSCIFCSTDAGPKTTRRQVEYVVEREYLVECFRELAAFKRRKDLEAHIDTVGDPLTYREIVELVQDLAQVSEVKVVSMQTHGHLLTERLAEELGEVGLERINLSIDATDPELARVLAGEPSYDVRRVMGVAEYIAGLPRPDVTLAPIWIPGLNDEEIPKIIEFALRIGAGKRWPPLGIQKYLRHKHGRKPRGIKPIPWYKFYKQLRIWEKKYGVRLILTPEDFGTHRARILPLVFRRNEVVRLKVVERGWLKGELLGVARGRVVTVVRAPREVLGKTVKVRITHRKHNLYIAQYIP